ncbi:hypothetical protein DNK57_01590 [Methanothermobacter thermautotrophicus]|uniref:Alpha/beta fold hydrolase n=1 Tax=Methanothermobacter thermautotrophicus TaxID=145262 RepID=A0A842YJ71_METTF|nr:alpha/beta fold hydrolase [Methanothermobacter thermautotrophicus]MBE2899522.1 hypothetical protein [Methanothermobacter thermautotrophicus]
MKKVLMFIILVLVLPSGSHASDHDVFPRTVEGPAPVISESHGEGSGKYWIFRPAAQGRYPVVVLIHGWAATEPIFYMAWIGHLVGEGNIVVYPRYQNLHDTSSENFTGNAAAAVREALQRVDGEWNGELYLAGHSAGGLIAVNLAAREDIPDPEAVLAVQPGVSGNGSKLENLSGIPQDVLLVVMAGDSDTITGTADSYLIMRRTPQIPPERKMFLLVQSDRTLRADHLSPLAISEEFGVLVDNLDYSGYWKTLDILMKLAEENRTLTDVPWDELLDMGVWGDGTPFKRMKVIDVS